MFVLSVILSVRLVRALFVPLDLIQTGAELIARARLHVALRAGRPAGDGHAHRRLQPDDRPPARGAAGGGRAAQLLQKIVDASPAGIVICDFDGKVEQMNPAAERLLGELRDELPALAPRRVAADHASRRAAIEGRAAEFRDRGFAKSFYVIEEMTEELRLSEKAAYEKLIRMMSHEVNNSVGAVRSLLESSLRYAPQVGEADREDFTSALTIASARIDALNRFMAAFADVVRIPPPRRTPTSVDELVERVAALLRPELERTRHPRDARSRRPRRRTTSTCTRSSRSCSTSSATPSKPSAATARSRATFRDGVLTIADSGPGIAEADPLRALHALLHHQTRRPRPRPHDRPGDPRQPRPRVLAGERGGRRGGVSDRCLADSARVPKIFTTETQRHRGGRRCFLKESSGPLCASVSLW